MAVFFQPPRLGFQALHLRVHKALLPWREEPERTRAARAFLGLDGPPEFLPIGPSIGGLPHSKEL